MAWRLAWRPMRSKEIPNTLSLDLQQTQMWAPDASLPDLDFATMARSRDNQFEFEEDNESSPLLPPTTDYEDNTLRSRTRQSWEKVMMLVLAVVLLVSLGDQWQESPHARIMESVICYRYFEKVDQSKLLIGRDQIGPGAIGGVAEMLCKADDVQSELAMLRGWQSMFDGLPGLLLALLVGWAADKYGRKPFVLAGLLAFILKSMWVELVLWFWQSFNIKAVWFSTAFASVGGGSAMTVTFLFVVLSDLAPEAKRADAFLRAGAFNILAALVMPPLAAWLMKYTPWIPALGGTFLMGLSLVLYAFCPETLNFQKPLYSHHESVPSPSPSNTPFNAPLRPQTLAERAQHALAQFKQASSFVFDDWRVPATIAPFLLHMLVGTIGGLLLQYMSKRYGLTFADVTLLMTIRTGVIVLLLFIVLPYISTLIMRRYDLSGARKDLYLVRASLIFVVIGWILVGLSPNILTVSISIATASIGQGFPLLLRSFLTTLVPAHHIARVYSIVSIVDTLGIMIGSPLLAGMFKRGLALGGSWIGLPFYFTGLVGLMFLLLLCSVGLRKGEDGYASMAEDD